MGTVSDSRKALIYFHIKCNGDWKTIWQKITDREAPASNDIDTVVTPFLKAHKVVTLLDCGNTPSQNFSKIANRMIKPPFVMEYEGDESLFEDLTTCNAVSVEGSTVVSDKLSVKDKVAIVTLLPDHRLRICKGNRELFLKECDDEDWMSERLGSITTHFVVTTGDDRIAISSAIASGSDVGAVPGKSGCFSNQLIKDGARLIDCIEDLIVEGDGDKQ